jgi:hypothetical protein
MDRELDPCIVFSFSKKACETYALQMARYCITILSHVLSCVILFTHLRFFLRGARSYDMLG